MTPQDAPAGGGPVYRRVLLKLSGEALVGDSNQGIDPARMVAVAGEIRDVVALGVEVASSWEPATSSGGWPAV
jgi:hypothetical protein